MRTYYESQNKKPYNIKETYTGGKSDTVTAIKTTTETKKKKSVS